MRNVAQNHVINSAKTRIKPSYSQDNHDWLIKRSAILAERAINCKKFG